MLAIVVPVPSAQAAPPAYVACPIAKPTVAKSRPPRPSPPAHEQSTVGGEGLATKGLAVPDGAPKLPGNTTATSWLVADLDSGEVLGACGPHEYATPASVQKLLLVATMLPKLDPKQVVTVTQEDLEIEAGSSAVGLQRGRKYSVELLWLGLLLQSGNDAANVLARIGAGTGGAKAGVAAMNAEAQRLGAYETHAVTPSGLDGKGQFTSAYDLALIARTCFDMPDFRKYATTMRVQMRSQSSGDKGFQIQNENKLLTEYQGALGGKTGFTTLARHSYVGAAKRGDRRLVVTLLGAEATPLRGWQQGAALLDWGFSLPRGASVGQLVTPEEIAQEGADVVAASAAADGSGAETVRKGAAASDAPAAWWSPTMVAAVALGVFALPVALLAVSATGRRGRRRRRGEGPVSHRR